jgi:hypothetical protein
MDKFALAGKIVSGVAIAIVINKITPHVEEALDKTIAKAQQKSENPE